jgi:putative heme-binding domain-containing protein
MNDCPWLPRPALVSATSLTALGVFILAYASTVLGQAPDSSIVRETQPLSAEEERSKLHVPEGFAVQLFASEPMINKPINIAFDDRGRLWLSSTVEYPYAAKRDRWVDAEGSRVRDSRDAIKILEDTDGDGRADRVIDFADGLNIPTGVLPWHKPEHQSGCIAWSIPNIWYFYDTTGDGKCDQREVLFGPLGFEKDTHGMCSSFRMGPDGWVYGTHGFNNTSHFRVREKNLKGARPGDPGTQLDLDSGNVYRFRPDGSRIEIWSWGQVNPFGLAFDRRGNLYSADCHSAPVYQLLRGAHYPSFGKGHEGLGFGPAMIKHHHGSTGICGIVYLDEGVWGKRWNDHVLIGNPVTSRINRDRIEFHGTTPVAIEQEDFVVSADPWFRPVDLRLGPEGALYVADFYNRIIGHYEVPLDHPGRDRERGRIWRIVKTDGMMSPLIPPNPVKVADPIAALESDSPSERRAAAEAWQFDPKLEALDPLRKALAETPAEDTHLRHGLRMAIREHLKLPGAFKQLELSKNPAWNDSNEIAKIALAVPSPEAAAYLVNSQASKVLQPPQLKHVARYGSPQLVNQLVSIAQSHPSGGPGDIQRVLREAKRVDAIQQGLEERIEPLPNPPLLQWAQELARQLLHDKDRHHKAEIHSLEGSKAVDKALTQLAAMLKVTAPVDLRDRLKPYLPPQPAPAPLPVSKEQRQQLDELIASRSQFFQAAKPDLKKGAALFTSHCATCHQLGGKGGLIGPQLDGIGARGVERLCEDILDPNRNVDSHFHLHQFTLKDGTSVGGFVRSESAQMIRLVDAAGQEHRLAKSNIANKQISPMSLMPPAFGQTLGEEDFRNLLGYLLKQ